MMLLRKVLRDLKQNAVQFLAIYIMTLLALLVVSGFDASDNGVYQSAAEYLTDHNFKDLNIEGRYFDHEDIAMLENMDGVAHVNGILHGTGKTVLDKERPLVISYIDGNEVSSMYLTEGELTRVLETEGVYPVSGDARELEPGEAAEGGEEAEHEQQEYGPQELHFILFSRITGPPHFPVVTISTSPSPSMSASSTLSPTPMPLSYETTYLAKTGSGPGVKS